MQAHNSQSLWPCINCDRPMRPGVMKYLLSDMAVEMLAWMELKLKKEVNDKSWLCENCFTKLGNTWSASQEPEVMDFSESTALKQDPDPLLVNRFLVEEVKIETEEEAKSFEHYDYKVEIDTSQPEEDCNELAYEEKSELDSGDDIECVEEKILTDADKDCVKEKMLNDDSDDDCVPDTEESSEDEAAKTLLSVPCLLDGASLRSGTKCDSCSTLLTKQHYRKLPDGPEKDFFVVNQKRCRDVSPERVCNPCYLKAHTAVVKQNKKDEMVDDSVNGSVPISNTIVIPGYQRFARTCSRCIVLDCTSADRLRVPDYLRVFLLKFYNIYTPEQSRICREHSKEYIRDWSFLKDHKYGTELSAVDVTEMLDLLRDDALKHPD